MTKMKFAPFDAADYLDNEETIAEYISAALEDPNPGVFLAAVRAAWRNSPRMPDLGVKASTKPLPPAPNRATTPC